MSMGKKTLVSPQSGVDWYVDDGDVPLSCAYLPHSIKTTPSRLSLTALMMASVKRSHPLSLCELGLRASTVSTAFSSNTP